MKLTARISGRTRTDLPAVMVQDLFEVAGPPADALRLVPGALDESEPVPFLGGPPEDRDTKAIARIVEPLHSGAPWSAWVAAVPLVPDIGAQARLDPLEHAILRHLHHLQQVCHRPRLHLRVEEERVPVTRARRIPARAVAALVSHPGDWEHRSLRSIRPSRVLARQVEDDVDLYENRVAARLVDHLLLRVGQRIEDLGRLADLARDAHDFTEETRGSVWRARRLAALWGRSVVGDTLSHEVARTLATLERVQRDLQALLDTPLYRNVPPKTFVPVALRQTNILVNDPHYREVAALWRAWAKWGHDAPPTRAEIRDRRQKDCASFDAFAMLVVVLALHDLGYRSAADVALPPPGAIRLDGPMGEARLRTETRALRIDFGGRSLRIVAVLSPVTPDTATALCEEITRGADRPDDTVVFLLGRRDDGGHAGARTARMLAGWGRPRVVLLSPWSLDCVERVARILWQAEAEQRFAVYPPQAPLRGAPGVDLPDWMTRIGDTVAVIAPADSAARASFADVCKRRRDGLKREEKAAKAARRSFDPGQLRALDEVRALAERAVELEPLRRCPVCKIDPCEAFEPRLDDRGDVGHSTFWCQCPGCSSAWGLRACGACGRRFPVLVVKTRAAARDEARADPGWIDRTFGRDVWAEPCAVPGAEGAFHCSHCGACPSGGCLRPPQ